MTLRLYNTYSKRKEDFLPLTKGEVKIYNCGPTVYSYAHIGNFRSFAFADVLRRYLEFRGFKVRQVMNITDVGHLTEDTIDQGVDKLEKAAREGNLTVVEIARKFEEAFHQDRKKLNLLDAEAYPRATDYVPKMIEWVKTLIDKGHAYEVDGEVYFDISTFPKYGRLSGNSLEDLTAGARIAVDTKKKSPLDFALWKADPKHLMKWTSPWSEGFPGWHIECSVMGTSILGQTLDIHTGGEDNIFPHHESEIAQSEAATGEPFVRYWMHARHLLVDGKKMSKSEGNFYTVRQIFDKGFGGLDLRYVYLSSHYRQPCNFTFDGLEGARTARLRLQNFVDNLKIASRDKETPEADGLCKAHEERFVLAMNDDLNTAGALAAVFDFTREINKLEVGKSGAALAIAQMQRFDTVLGVLQWNEETKDPEAAEIDALVQKRQEARKAKDFAEADRIRDELMGRDIVLEDTPQGPRWKRKRG